MGINQKLPYVPLPNVSATWTDPVTFKDISFNVLVLLNVAKRFIRCDLCGTVVVLRGEPGEESWVNLESHRNKQKCRVRAMERKNKQLAVEEEIARAAAQQERLHGGSSAQQATGPQVARPRVLSEDEPCTSTEHVTFRRPLGSPHPVDLEISLHGFIEGVEQPPPQFNFSRIDEDTLPSSYLEYSLEDDEDDEDDDFSNLEAFLPEILDLSAPILCRGQMIKWPGSVWETYCYQQHVSNNVPFMFREVVSERWVRLQSRECKVLLQDDQRDTGACSACRRLVNDRRVRQTITNSSRLDAPAHTPYKYLTSLQKDRLLHRLNTKVNALKLELLNKKRRVRSLAKRCDETKKILVYISQNKIPAASRILKRAIRRGESSRLILNDLLRAATGKFRAREPWTEEELDLANLIRLEGGPRLLYALSRMEGHPSATTLRRRKPIPELLPSIGTPDALTIGANIRAFLGPKGRHAPDTPLLRGIGQVLMVDDIALEEVLRYDTRRNSVLGFCREHGPENATINSMADVETMQSDLHAGRCHYAKEATVAVIAPITGSKNYFPSPLCVSGSCKAETADQLVKWLSCLITTYQQSESGEKLHGPIYTLATDGASTFRRARFDLCLKHHISEFNSDLAGVLRQLPGVNLRCGSNGLLGTCDFKHVIKRFATWIRSTTGIQVGKTHIENNHIYEALITLDRLTPQEAHRLLNPTDKQNVPAAVKLLQSLLEVSDQPSGDSIPTAPLRQRVKDITFIAKVAGSFLLPFVSVNMSLSEQIRSLSKYSHLVTALYRTHGTNFLTGALLADSQAIVKNIIFTAARLKLLNPDTPYHILLDGTDRLEGVFGAARTHDHARNFDILQLVHKLCIGTEINAIYERNPNLHKGHRRLNLVNSRGVDHVNPASWVGDVIVGNLDLRAEYLAGRTEAITLLKCHLGEANTPDFDEIFADNNCDHLRPDGKGYVGLRKGDADFVEPEVTTTVAATDIVPTHLTSQASVDPESTPGTECDAVENGEDDEMDLLDAENIEDDVSESSDQDSEEAEMESDEELEEEYARLSEHLEINPLTVPQLSTAYLACADGTMRSKHTLVAQYLTQSSDGARKLVNRVFRVRRDTMEGMEVMRQRKRDEMSRALEKTSQHVSTGDAGLILVRSGNHISAAIVECLNFKQKNSKHILRSVPFEDLEDAKKDTSIAVQLLSMVPHLHKGRLCWFWDGAYSPINAITANEKYSPKNYAFRIPASRFYPIAPLEGPSLTGTGQTWLFDHADLESMMNEAWGEMNPNGDDILTDLRQLPQVDGCAAHLPLTTPSPRERDGPPVVSLHIADAPLSFEKAKKPGDSKHPCLLCGKSETISAMRNHVGHHIIFAHRGVSDKLLPSHVEVGFSPCGWCGLSEAGCRTELVVGEKGKKDIFSTCTYAYEKMMYKKAQTVSTTTPCTNVPIQCTLCPAGRHGQHPSFWKYNFFHHMAEHHRDSGGRIVRCPQELRDEAHISMAEEKLMKVKEDVTEAHRGLFDHFDASSGNPALEVGSAAEDVTMGSDSGQGGRWVHSNVSNASSMAGSNVEHSGWIHQGTSEQSQPAQTLLGQRIVPQSRKRGISDVSSFSTFSNSYLAPPAKTHRP